MDEFDAIERWMALKNPVVFDIGRVASISPGQATVFVGGVSKTQPATFDGSAILNVGDDVLLARPRGRNSWQIVTVVNRRSHGTAQSNRETPNNKAGSHRFSKVQNNGAGSAASVNSTTVTTYYTADFIASGGSLEIVFNGVATLSGGTNANLRMYVLINDALEQVFEDNLDSVEHAMTAVNWVHLIPGPLDGKKTIEIQAQMSAAAHTVSLACFAWKIKEI